MKKKLVALALTVCMAAGMLAGCGKNAVQADNGNTYNKEYKDELNSIDGSTVDMTAENVTKYKASGIAFTKPESWGNITNILGINISDYSPYGVILTLYPEEAMNKAYALTEDSTEDEINEVYAEIAASRVSLMAIVRANESEEGYQDTLDMMASYSNQEELATIGDDTYYFAYNTEAPEGDYTDNDKADLQIIFDSIEEFKNSIVIFPPVDPLEDFKVDLSSFTTTDLDGNEITQDILADYDVTMVNVWATWCQYCIEEMPTIEKLYEDKADNVNIITICMDAEDEPDTAQNEMTQVGSTFPVLVGNDELKGLISEYLSGYPTTFFVDSTGKVIGELQVGVPSRDADEAYAGYTELIEEALNGVK